MRKLADRAMYFACVNFVFFCLLNDRSEIISGPDGPIFTVFAPDDRYLFVDD